MRSYGPHSTLTSYLICVIAAIVPFDVVSVRAFAQITSDDTLPNNSRVTVQDKTRIIEEGTKVGENLFHSFEKFSVPTGIIADFNNPLDIKNIITRVTGNEVSNINGLIRAKGTANLFLVNPKGIIFGRNASLNIGGSFIGSTASSINFADGTKLSANKESAPLLTVSVPVGLQFGANPGTIINQSQATDSKKQRVGLQVQPGKTLALVSGDITLNGGYLTAVGEKSAGGRIELGTVAGNSIVSLKPVSKGWALGYEGSQTFGDIKLERQAIVNASGNGSGDIQVQGRNVKLADGSQIRANTLSTRPGGNIVVNASEALEIIGTSPNGEQPSTLTTETVDDGKGGNLTVNTKRLLLKNGGLITTGSSLYADLPVNSCYPVCVNRKSGAAGNLTIRASESVSLIGETITKTGKDTFQSRVTTQTRGNGAAGNLTIRTGKLIIQDGGQISAGTTSRSKGAGGSLTITAADSIEVVGASVYDEEPSRITNQTAGAGNARTLTINTKKLSIRSGGQVGAPSVSRRGPDILSTGRGGNLNINADYIEVVGVYPSENPKIRNFYPSRLTTRTEGRGKAGDLTINTISLIIKDGAQVSAGTAENSRGGGGKLTVNASESIEVIGEDKFSASQFPSRLTNGTSGRGNVANSKITTTKLIIRNGGQVSSDTSGQGSAGRLDVTASDFINVQGKASNGNQSKLSAMSTTASSAGDLNITTRQLTIQDGAEVSVSSNGLGDAGNLFINSSNITLNNQGSIKASTASGEGGNVKLQVLSLILMRRNSSISTEAGNNGNGGNIDINARFIVANKREDSNIVANAERGRGGNISINTEGLYGLEYRPKLTEFSDINASSQFGINGNVLINAPDFDPNQGLINLPVEPGTPQVAQGCQVKNDNQNQFVVTGRGGLPSNPRVAFSSDTPQVDWVTRTRNSEENKTKVTYTKPKSLPIVEANNWIVNVEGEIFLTATNYGLNQAPVSVPCKSALLPSQF